MIGVQDSGCGVVGARVLDAGVRGAAAIDFGVWGAAVVGAGVWGERCGRQCQSLGRYGTWDRSVRRCSDGCWSTVC